jgi:hypothetical protein
LKAGLDKKKLHEKNITYKMIETVIFEIRTQFKEDFGYE